MDSTGQNRETAFVTPPLQPVKALAGFSCRQCGACCRIPDGIVRVSGTEIARIARFLGTDEEAFIASQTALAPDRKSLVLLSRPGGACAFLDAANRCRIHPVKPEKCRSFPFDWTNPDSFSVCPALAALAPALKAPRPAPPPLPPQPTGAEA